MEESRSSVSSWSELAERSLYPSRFRWNQRLLQQRTCSTNDHKQVAHYSHEPVQQQHVQSTKALIALSSVPSTTIESTTASKKRWNPHAVVHVNSTTPNNDSYYEPLVLLLVVLVLTAAFLLVPSKKVPKKKRSSSISTVPRAISITSVNSSVTVEDLNNLQMHRSSSRISLLTYYEEEEEEEQEEANDDGSLSSTFESATEEERNASFESADYSYCSAKATTSPPPPVLSKTESSDEDEEDDVSTCTAPSFIGDIIMDDDDDDKGQDTLCQELSQQTPKDASTTTANSTTDLVVVVQDEQAVVPSLQEEKHALLLASPLLQVPQPPRGLLSSLQTQTLHHPPIIHHPSSDALPSQAQLRMPVPVAESLPPPPVLLQQALLQSAAGPPRSLVRRVQSESSLVLLDLQWENVNGNSRTRLSSSAMNTQAVLRTTKPSQRIRRRSSLLSSNDSVSTLDTDVDLDVGLEDLQLLEDNSSTRRRSSNSSLLQLLEENSSTRRRSSNASIQQRIRRRSSLLSCNDSVCTMDTDVDLDVGLGLVASNSSRLLCWQEQASFDDDSSYETDDDDDTIVSFTDLRLTSGGGGVILADVLALDDQEHFLTLPSSNNSTLALSSGGNKEDAIVPRESHTGRGTEKRPSVSLVRRASTSDLVDRDDEDRQLLLLDPRASNTDRGSAVVPRMLQGELVAQEDDREATDALVVSREKGPSVSLLVRRASTSDLVDRDEDRQLLRLDPNPALEESRNASRNERRRRRKKKRLLTRDEFDLDREIVKAGTAPIISNLDALVLGKFTAKPRRTVDQRCSNKKHRQRLKNARLVLRVVLGSGRKDFKTSKACFQAIDQVVSFKREMMAAIQEVSKSQQVLHDVKKLWSDLLKRQEKLCYSALPQDPQAWDACDTSIHLIQQVQDFIHPAATITIRSNTYPKIDDIAESGRNASNVFLGSVDGLPVPLTINLIDSDPATRSRLTPYKYDKHLPLSLQDALRAVRAILPPKHNRVSGGDCLQAIQMYALLQIQFKRLHKQLQVERLFFQELNKTLSNLVKTLTSAYEDRSPETIRRVAASIQQISRVLVDDEENA